MKKNNHFLIIIAGTAIFAFITMFSFDYVANLKATYAYTAGECNNMSDELLSRIESGEEKLTYECFGAAGDGVTDDFEAIKATHDFANKEYAEKGIFLTVHGTSSANYRINSGDENGIYVTTDTDWHGAKFTIDDNPDIILSNKLNESPVFRIASQMHLDARCSMLDFNVETGSAECAVNNMKPNSNIWNSLSINKNTTNVKSFVDTILNDILKPDSKMLKYYKDSQIWAINVTSNHMNYIRTGVNQDSGKRQTELILINSKTGDVLSDIEWDYDDFYQIRVWPVPEKKLTIKNGDFTTWTNNRAISSDGKENPYSQRGIYVAFTGNVLLQNINHYLDEDKYPYTGEYQTNPKGNAYKGFIRIYNASNIELNTVNLDPHTFAKSSKANYGTYDLIMEYSNNIFLNKLGYSCNNSNSEACYNDKMVNSSKWGIIQSSGIKDTFIRNSTVNRIDAHRGAHNLLVENTKIGREGFTLIGSGYFYGKNLTIDRANNIIQLRHDFGSTWNGTMLLDNITYTIDSNVTSPTIIHSNNYQSNYGYNTYFPAVYIKDLTIDDTTYNADKDVTLVHLNAEADPNGASKYEFKGNIRSMNVKFKGNNNHLYLFTDEFVNNDSNLSLNSYSGDNVVNIGYTNNDSNFAYTTNDELTNKLNDQSINTKFSFTNSDSTIETVADVTNNMLREIQTRESKASMPETGTANFAIDNIQVTANATSNNATNNGNDTYTIKVPNGTKDATLNVQTTGNTKNVIYPETVTLTGDTTRVDITVLGTYTTKKVYHLDIIQDKNDHSLEKLTSNPKTGNLIMIVTVIATLIISVAIIAFYSKKTKENN